MASARKHFQSACRAGAIGTCFALLLFPGFVANGGPEVHPSSARKRAPRRAHEHAEAALLEDVDVMVVSVSHGPARGVAAGFLAPRRQDEAAMAVSPFHPFVENSHLLRQKTNTCKFPAKRRVAVIRVKKHKRQRRKRQSVTA